MLLSLALATGEANAQVDPECDANQDGVVDDLPENYSEDQQYANLLNFYAVTMGVSPLHSPAALEGFKLVPSLELAGIPQLDCGERAVFGGIKTENTNKTPLFPRIRVQVNLPFGLYAGLSGVPPVKIFGVQTGMIGLELGYGRVLADRFEVGLRGFGLYGSVKGDLAGPLPGQEEADDTFKDIVWGIDAGFGFRIPVGRARITPYLGLGFTSVTAEMYVAETDNLVPTGDEQAALLYNGLHGQLGVAALLFDRLDLALEGYFVPLGISADSYFRNFFSPRLRIGYAFF